MNNLKNSLVIAAAATLLLAACKGKDEAEMVFVAGPEFTATLTLSPVTAPIPAGESIKLPVQRTAGPWQKLPRSQVPEGTQGYVQEPPITDPQVFGIPLLFAAPQTCIQSQSFDNASGTATAVFASPDDGACEVWAEVAIPPDGHVVRSESINITVAKKP